MNGGEIKNNSIVPAENGSTGDVYGGGIRFGSSSFTMNGGKIENNSINGNKAYGGGVYSGGSVIINRGSVSGNTVIASTAYGAGLCMAGTAAITLNGSEVRIINNKAGEGSGTVYGGGIYAEGAVNYNNGLVLGNNLGAASATYGGGICVNGTNGNITMSGGRVAGNYAYRGGGIYFAGGGLFRMRNGIISGNTASNSGGGIWLSGTMGGFQKTFYGASSTCGIIYGSEVAGIDEFGYDLKNIGSGAAICYIGIRNKNTTISEITVLFSDDLSDPNWSD